MDHKFGGPWTEQKLQCLGKYLEFYTTALKNTAFTTLYIDAFAGNGHCLIKTRDGERVIPGSAKIALETVPPFSEYHLFESNPSYVQQLHALAAQHPELNIHIHESDSNTALPQLLSRDWRSTRAALFLDPYGLELEWETVQKIAQTKATDVWFLVSLSGVYRNAPNAYSAIDEGKKAALNRFLGTDGWQHHFYRQDDLFADHGSRTASWENIVEFIKKRLDSIFEGGALEPVILRHDANNAPLYALFFALANPSKKAMSLAKRVAADIMRSV